MNFDPRTLGVYIPPDHHLIQDIPMDLIQSIDAGCIDALEEILSSDLIDNDQHDIISKEKKRLEVESAIEGSSPDPQKMEWAWRSVWENLKDGQCLALAVDDICHVHKIDDYFWSSEFVTETFSSGVMPRVPPYRPHGRVVIAETELKKLRKKYYRQGYLSVLPSGFGLHPDVEEISDRYSNSLIGEIGSPKDSATTVHGQVDKEQYLLAVCEVVHTMRVFKSKAELGRLASDIYEKRNPEKRRPAIRTTDPVVEKVWERLGLKDTPVSEVRRIRDAGL